MAVDHAQKTKFARVGPHVKLNCHLCHPGRAASQKLPTPCSGCHRGDDVHGGALKGGCETCHDGDTWKSGVNFDHDLGSFPLLGLHVVVGCGQCHTSRSFAGAV